jgi:hypothetical protein
MGKKRMDRIKKALTFNSDKLSLSEKRLDRSVARVVKKINKTWEKCKKIVVAFSVAAQKQFGKVMQVFGKLVLDSLKLPIEALKLLLKVLDNLYHFLDAMLNLQPNKKEALDQFRKDGKVFFEELVAFFNTVTDEMGKQYEVQPAEVPNTDGLLTAMGFSPV